MADTHRPPEEFTLRLRRYDPESGEAPFWEEHTVELEPHRSVLEGILQAKARFDGSIGIRCSCRAAICGSCGVRVNGEPGLACHTHLDHARESAREGVIEIEPMGNMPVIKDLIVDMDAVHWKKIQRVTPWLLAQEPMPEREHIVPRESMVDITQTMACIQCGACVSDCLAMEVDPGFIGPAALAKAYRFVGDPRDAEQFERLNDLSQDPQGIYDCTHCFKCVDACPKDVNPMGQIMRLRRIAGSDQKIVDANNGHRHEQAMTSLVRDYGLNHEAELLPRSYGGDSWFAKFHPAAAKELLSSLGVMAKGILRGKLNPKIALLGHKIPKQDLDAVKKIYKTVEGREERYELNLYITGADEEDAGEQAPVSATAGDATSSTTEPGGSANG
ncbi:MAG TPA: 2Fe-2S iron-sulfur cluster-binding protein [Solirubrobacteraceae bacterium]|jgi:succinate dehydrogenase / fumarate reductase iron-sulfur subunit|nr:2Fe-2S iron-sulfur cluster-binding protein [Solirubrobacteraceae bacterium]